MARRRVVIVWLSIVGAALVAAGAGAASTASKPPPKSPPKKGRPASETKLTASDAASGDRFGIPVAVSADGKVALVGAEQKNSFQGAAYVFVRGPHGWSQQQELTATDGAPFDVFGSAVALSRDGKVALVGAVQKNSFQGAAYVFVRGPHGWSQQQELTASDGAPNDGFGGSAALSGDGKEALVGAAGRNSGTGAAYVFARGAHGWAQRQELTASDGAANDAFGGSVALSGDGKVALVGAHFHSSNRGAAYLFVAGRHGWSQRQELLGSAGDPLDQFGVSVALNGNGKTALVGAVGRNSFHGVAEVFVEGQHMWSKRAELTANDGTPGDDFGLAVALSGDGNKALVGAAGKNSFQGAAYVYGRRGQGWSQRQELTASDGAPGEEFGLAVALDGNGKTALIGAPTPFMSTSGPGAAYLYGLK
jgi:hypothetical protein